MRKRQREDLCGVCGHYHKYEEGEVCGICGHQVTTNVKPTTVSASSPILPDFLYLGGFNDASCSVTLKFQGISHILTTVPSCSILYPRTFTYYRLEDEKALDLDKAIQFLEECEKKKFRVLVHCMSGKSRSPAIVIAYLMKLKGWRLAESYNWVKQCRPLIDISPEFQQQLTEFEEKLFGSRDGSQDPEHSNQHQDLGSGAVNMDSS